MIAKLLYFLVCLLVLVLLGVLLSLVFLFGMDGDTKSGLECKMSDSDVLSFDEFVGEYPDGDCHQCMTQDLGDHADRCRWIIKEIVIRSQDITSHHHHHHHCIRSI